MKQYHIGLVVGEDSGDSLAADLIAVLKSRYPAIKIEGIVGPRAIAKGAHAVFPMEKIAVMGLIEIIKKLPFLLRIRRKITRYFLNNPPDLFIGIDAPEFNLAIEKTLKKQGIKTIHYVSPSVWAWREYRTKAIAKACDHILTLFPFEPPYYHKKNIPATFIGHPLADQIPENTDQKEAKALLKLPGNKKIIVLLPGSRQNELENLGNIFLQTAQHCLQYDPSLYFIAAMANEHRYKQFMNIVEASELELPITIIKNHTRDAIIAADVVLAASGTVTLECLLLKRPMVVCYKMSAITYAIMKKLYKLPYVSLPNILSAKHLVPEFIQSDATPEKLSAALLATFDKPQDELIKEFTNIHRILRCQASEKAADIVASLLVQYE